MTKEEFINQAISQGIIPERDREKAERFTNRFNMTDFNAGHIAAFARSLERTPIEATHRRIFTGGYNSVAMENDPTSRGSNVDRGRYELAGLYKMMDSRKLRKPECAYTRDENGKLQLNKDRLDLRRTNRV